MKILVLGSGSIGRRHIRNLLTINIGEVSVCDISNEKLQATKKEFGIKTYFGLDEALLADCFDVAFICTPPSLHVKQAIQLLEKGMHCFIEKPLSNTLEGIDELIGLAVKKKKIVMVGYSLRFSSFFEKIKEIINSGTIGKVLFLKASIGYYLPYWRPNEDYRKGYGASQKLGGGIILDASHEIDYVRYLLGEVKEVFAISGKISSLEIDTEDYAEIIMRFENDVYAQIHFDYLQSNYRRNCEIVGDKGMLIWNINKNKLEQYSIKDNEYHVYCPGLNATVNEMYLREIKHFFNCISTGEKPLIDLDEAKLVQEIILKIRRSSEERKFIPV